MHACTPARPCALHPPPTYSPTAPTVRKVHLLFPPSREHAAADDRALHVELAAVCGLTELWPQLLECQDLHFQNNEQRGRRHTTSVRIHRLVGRRFLLCPSNKPRQSRTELVTSTNQGEPSSRGQISQKSKLANLSKTEQCSERDWEAAVSQAVSQVEHVNQSMQLVLNRLFGTTL